MPFKPHFSWDFLSPDEIEERTIRAMRNHIEYLKRDSQYYQKILASVEPRTIVDIKSIASLPCTTKDDIVSDPEAFRVASHEEIVETIVTSPPRPFFYPLTSSDSDRLAYSGSLSFHSAGVAPQDKALIMLDMGDMLLEGLSLYRGLTALEVNTIRTNGTDFELPKRILAEMKPTIIVGTSSHLAKFGVYLESIAKRPLLSCIEKVFCINESVRTKKGTYNGTGRLLQKHFSAQFFSTILTTEVLSNFAECSEMMGNHTHPELVYTEIINPDGSLVKEGEVGEIVVTSFGVEGMPLLRYKTELYTSALPYNCQCGRNSLRLAPFEAHQDTMFTIRDKEISKLTLIAILDSSPVIGEYLIELKGMRGSKREEVLIHAVIKPYDVSGIMTHIRNETKLNIPVLVSNSATLKAMRKAADSRNNIIDSRK